jgi:hypothetical membrane protein
MALLTQKYELLLEPISNLGMGSKGIFFNLGLIFSGIIGIFVVYGRYKRTSRTLLLLGLFAMTSLSLVGFFPKPMDLHGLFTGMMFIGMALFFIAYTIKAHSFLTLIMLISFVVFPFYNISLSEWIVLFAVNGWMFMTSTKLHYKNTKKYINL